MAFNHQLAFRPLRAGIEIFNARVGEVGTLGLVAEDEIGGRGRYLVSCYHVLVGGSNQAPVDGEPVFQPASAAGADAFVDATRADATLDCAAAEIAPTVESIGEILGIGRIASAADPTVGLRVLKSGAATGITEGVIAEVNGHQVIITVPEGFDPNYELSTPGDSGAVWLARDDHAPVALHVAEMPGREHRVRAHRIKSVLQVLRLRPLD